MKRYGNLWNQFISKENFLEAWRLTKRRRGKRCDIKKFAKNLENNLENLRQQVARGEFTTSEYHTKSILENGKKRLIYILPLPDRIVQHALVNIVEPIFVKGFITQTYGCIKGRGQLKGSMYVRKHINNYDWVLKTDVRKFYPTIDQNVLYSSICRKIKDKKLLEIIHDIVYSIPGEKNCPIGNLFSQLAGNIYLDNLDKFVKHELKARRYCRYCDDCVILSNSKEELQTYKQEIKKFVKQELKQELSYCEIFPVKQGIDFLGYRHFKGYTILRKRTALKFKQALTKIKSGKDRRSLLEKLSTINSYKGSARHCYTYNLIRKLEMNKTIADLTVTEFKKVGSKPELPLTGKKISILKLFDKSIIILAWKQLKVEDRDTTKLQFVFEDDEQLYVTFTSSSTIRRQLENIELNNYPVKATVKKQGEAFYLE